MRSRPVLANPDVIVDQRAADVDGLRVRSGRVLEHRLDRADADVSHTVARLRALSPAATLQRGYAIVQRTDDGAIVRDPSEVTAGDAVRLRVAGGDIAATVTKGEPDEAAADEAGKPKARGKTGTKTTPAEKVATS